MHVVLKEARILQTILDLFLDLLLFIVFWELSMFPNESSLKMQFDYFQFKILIMSFIGKLL